MDQLQFEERLQLLRYFRDSFDDSSEAWQSAVQLAYQKNAWFTPENIKQAWKAIVATYLNEDNLSEVSKRYPKIVHLSAPKDVGIVMAGNIPLVGFHDLLCTFLSGHVAHVKLSSKDEVLIPFIVDQLTEIDPRFSTYVHFEDQLKGLDGYIATGSNNSVRYFQTYFGKYPSIIRHSRSSIAILDGQESDEELIALGGDVFSYFGLGCRSVSKLYVPQGYNFERMLGLWQEHFIDIIHHNAYMNNYDYSYALYLLNKVPFLMNGCVLITEDKQLVSRIAMLHYEQYKDQDDVTHKISPIEKDIQCIVSRTDQVPDLTTVPMGSAQLPDFFDYADDIDTLSFLIDLDS